MNGNVSIAKNLTVTGNLYVNAYTTRQTVTSVDYQFIVAQDMSLNGNLYMTGDASINSRLYV
jgi:hypothetical protein